MMNRFWSELKTNKFALSFLKIINYFFFAFSILMPTFSTSFLFLNKTFKNEFFNLFWQLRKKKKYQYKKLLLDFFKSLIIILGYIIGVVVLIKFIEIKKEGFLILTGSLLSVVFLIKYHFKNWDWKAFKNNKDLDKYKNIFINIFFFSSIIMLGLTLIIVTYFLNGEVEIMNNNQNVIIHNTTNFQISVNNDFKLLNDVNPLDLWNSINSNYGYFGFGGLLFFMGFLIGFSFSWIGITSFIFLFVSNTYQNLIFLVTTQINNLNTWGAIFALIFGILLGSIIYSWIQRQRIKKKMASLSLSLTSAAAILNFLVPISYYYNDYQWALWEIIVPIIMLVLFLFFWYLKKGIIFWRLKKT